MDDDADDDDVWVTIRYDHMAADLPAASGRFQSLLNVPSHPVPLPLPPRETSKPNSEVLTD
ncbi:hypothetical protein FOYG_12326 [Fusarium oxysporum NRRL 32931]|uniref:Uncharacterized protein n=1 Tax=Fusarium oxysporum NRRL 32931 TaxID=660029 RepID=W9HRV3_FUSOX|nr:hypothetical protein FOYG_12326 [Fusarium oxysporum NRRL 32931]